MITLAYTWKCWKGCEQHHSGICSEHGLFPRKVITDSVDLNKPYLAFWVDHGAPWWSLPNADLYQVYSSIDGELVGIMAKDGNKLVSFKGSQRKPQKYGRFRKCLTLRGSWVSFLSDASQGLTEGEMTAVVMKAWYQRTPQLEESVVA